MARDIYLDHNATTPCAKEVIEAMYPFLDQEYGNPSSPHRMGKRAYAACCAARESVAELIGCNSTEVVFTSGATESNNLVLLGVMASATERRKIVTTAVEHKSVKEPCRVLDARGFQVVELPVSKDCQVDLNAAAESIDESTAIVTIQGANNEVGVLQPVRQLAEMARTKGALFHCDAAQLLGKKPLPSDFPEFDFASFSAHKLYGPKGVGALFIRSGHPRRALGPTFMGGGQESGLRPGTLNVPGIVGLGEACRIAQKRIGRDMAEIESLRARFERSIAQVLPRSWINGFRAERLPGTCSLCIPNVPSTMLIANVPHLCIGEGSACTSGAPEPSHVLLAMGLSRENAECTVRISFGRQNSLAEVDEATETIARAAEYIALTLSRSADLNPVSAEERKT